MALIKKCFVNVSNTKGFSECLLQSANQIIKTMHFKVFFFFGVYAFKARLCLYY